MKPYLITYSLTLVGSVAAPFYPFIGLVVYICLACIRPESVWYWAIQPGNYSRIVAIAMLLGWAFRGFGDWRLGKAAAPVGALVAFLVWSILTAARAPNQEVAWMFVSDFSKIVLPVVVGVSIINTCKHIHILMWAITLSMGCICLELNQSFFAGVNLADGFGGMGRAILATALNTTAPVAFFLGLYERIWWRRLAAFGSCVLQFHAALIGASRGGMLGFIVIGIVTFIVIPKKLSYYIILVVAMLVGARLMGPYLVTRLLTVAADNETRDESAQGRLVLWSNCVELISRSPILGVGPDHFPLLAPEFGWEEGKESHHNWLCVGAEFGLPGLVLLWSYFGICLIRMPGLMRKSRSVPDPLIRFVASMVFAGLLGYFVCSQFVTVKTLEPPYYVTMLGIAALKLSSRHDRTENGLAEGEEPMIDLRVS